MKLFSYLFRAVAAFCFAAGLTLFYSSTFFLSIGQVLDAPLGRRILEKLEREGLL